MVDEPDSALTDEGAPPVANRTSIDVLPDESLTGIAGVISDLGRLDRAVYGVIADTPTPNRDVPLRELSSLANHSKIWFAIAGGLALFGGEPVGSPSSVVRSAVGNQRLLRSAGSRRHEFDRSWSGHFPS